MRRHWQGELSLAISVWLIGVPAAVALNAIALTAGPLLAERRDMTVPLAALAAFYLVFLIVTAWQFTGIWNEYLFGVVFTGGRSQPITASLIGMASGGTNVRVYDVMSAGVLIGAIPPLLIYFFGGRYFVRGLTQGAIK